MIRHRFVLGSILLGFVLEGGKIAALMQFKEFIIIAGAAFGSVTIGYGIKGTMSMMMTPLTFLKGNPYTKTTTSSFCRACTSCFLIGRKGA